MIGLRLIYRECGIIVYIICLSCIPIMTSMKIDLISYHLLSHIF